MSICYIFNHFLSFFFFSFYFIIILCVSFLYVLHNISKYDDRLCHYLYSLLRHMTDKTPNQTQNFPNKFTDQAIQRHLLQFSHTLKINKNTNISCFLFNSFVYFKRIFYVYFNFVKLIYSE